VGLKSSRLRPRASGAADDDAACSSRWYHSDMAQRARRGPRTRPDLICTVGAGRRRAMENRPMPSTIAPPQSKSERLLAARARRAQQRRQPHERAVAAACERADAADDAVDAADSARWSARAALAACGAELRGARHHASVSHDDEGRARAAARLQHAQADYVSAAVAAPAADDEVTVAENNAQRARLEAKLEEARLARHDRQAAAIDRMWRERRRAVETVRSSPNRRAPARRRCTHRAPRRRAPARRVRRVGAVAQAGDAASGAQPPAPSPRRERGSKRGGAP
jgi:hypothetical protein